MIALAIPGNDLAGIILAVLVLGYLIYALTSPERF